MIAILRYNLLSFHGLREPERSFFHELHSALALFTVGGLFFLGLPVELFGAE